MRILSFLLPLLAVLAQAGEPSWVKTPPTLPGRVYATGMAAVGTDETKAMEIAIAHARFEVLVRLQVTTAGTTTLNENYDEQQTLGKKPTATSTQSIQENIVTSVSVVKLPGLIIADRYTDKKTAYALCYLDVAIAEACLQDLADSVAHDWASLKREPTGFRPIINRLKEIQALRSRNNDLEEQAGILLAAGSSPDLSQGLHTMGQAMVKYAKSLQAKVTFGARNGQDLLSQDVVALLRNEVLKRGFTWTQDAPMIQVVVDLTDYTQTASSGIFANRASIRVTLQDISGTCQESFDLQVKGVGLNPAVASNSLRRDLAQNLLVKSTDFLTNLTSN